MHKPVRHALLAAAAALLAHTASADVLTFEDLAGTQYFGASYQGFSFGNLDPATNDWYWSDLVASPYMPHSGTVSVSTDAALYNNLPFETATGISSATAFHFDGAWFAGEPLNGDGSAAQVQYQLYLGGALVFTGAASAGLSATPLYHASGYAGLVDAVRVSGPQGYFAMDDFTYTAAVPEPSSGLMAALGGAAVLAAALRRRQAVRRCTPGSSQA